MDERTQKIIGATLGIGLLAAVLWYLFFRGKGTRIDTSNVKTKEDVQPTIKTTQVIVQPSTASASNDPNMIGYAQILALQNWSNSKWAGSVIGGQKVPKISADGALGPETAGVLKIVAPNIGAAVIGRNYKMALDEFKRLINYVPATTTVSVNVPVDVTIAGMGTSDIMSYIRSKTGSNLSTALNTWDTTALKIWADALKAGKGEFYCGQCWYKGYYSTQTGLKIR